MWRSLENTRYESRLIRTFSECKKSLNSTKNTWWQNKQITVGFKTQRFYTAHKTLLLKKSRGQRAPTNWVNSVYLSLFDGHFIPVWLNYVQNKAVLYHTYIITTYESSLPPSYYLHTEWNKTAKIYKKNTKLARLWKIRVAINETVISHRLRHMKYMSNEKINAWTLQNCT
jgi:hypothetical protein